MTLHDVAIQSPLAGSDLGERRIERAIRFGKRLGWGQRIPGWDARAKEVALALYRLLVAWERRRHGPGHLAGVVPIDQRAAARALTASLGYPVSRQMVSKLIDRFHDVDVGLLATWACHRRAPDRGGPRGLACVYVLVTASTPEVLAAAHGHLLADVAERPRRERERLARYRRRSAEQARSVVGARDDRVKQRDTKALKGSEVSSSDRVPSPASVADRVAVGHSGARPAKGGMPLTLVLALADTATIGDEGPGQGPRSSAGAGSAAVNRYAVAHGGGEGQEGQQPGEGQGQGPPPRRRAHR